MSNDFIEFFKSYFNVEKLKDDMDLNLRFYISILQSYIDYIKIPDEELITSWEKDIKPYLFKIYPFQQNGIFNVNADIKYLIKEIDSLIVNSKNIIMNKNKKDQEQEEFENDLEIMKIDDEEEIMNHQNNNDITNKDIKIDKSIKRCISMNNLLHTSSITSKSTSAVTIYDELNNKSDDLRSSFSNAITTIKPKVKEMSPYFSDEFSTEGVTIIHNKKVLTQMSFNLFLKKIVVGNFFNDYFEYSINFIDQCFYFMKRDIVFKKIINCYKYYTDLKVPFNQRKNLVHFMNILVIKMYECFTKIESNEDILSIIKTFYNNLINELKPIVDKSKKPSTKLQDFFFGGIKALRSSVNTINKNIKENFGNKIKDIKGNKENKEEKEGKEDINSIKENLNIILTKRHEVKEEQEKQKIKYEKKEEEKKEENKEKEKNMIPEEELLIECEKIVSLFKNEIQKQDILTQTEQSLYIYNLKINYQKSKKNNKNIPKARTLQKSQTTKFLITLPTLEENKPKSVYIKKPYFSCLNYEVKDIGEELLSISQTSLNKIKRKELYNGAFLKKSKLITSPNVIENINKFNKLISFIIEDILSYDFPKDRAKIIERWANIADYCRKRKDYNDLFAINSVFKNFIIVGLDLTWKEIGNKTRKLIREIDNFCSFEGNYKNVREDMKLLNKNEFYTPYLGLLLKDLNFYEENLKYLNGNLINFEKINRVQNSIDDFFRFQKNTDKRTVILNDDLNFFENLENQKESYLENIANKLEPKFTLYNNPKKVKRYTYIDKKYFKGHSGKGLLSNSVRPSIV